MATKKTTPPKAVSNKIKATPAKQPKSKNTFRTLAEEEVKVIPKPTNYEGTCIECHWFQDGGWFGPKCGNPESPYYGMRKAESGTCIYGEYKEDHAARTLVAPVTSTDDGTDNEDGLYDVDPAEMRDSVQHAEDVFDSEEEEQG